MVSLMSWVRSRLKPSANAAWCVHCHAHRTVREVEIVPARNNAQRMVGECDICGGKTSTFVSRG
jgi:hypothetical protein